MLECSWFAADVLPKFAHHQHPVTAVHGSSIGYDGQAGVGGEAEMLVDAHGAVILARHDQTGVCAPGVSRPCQGVGDERAGTTASVLIG